MPSLTPLHLHIMSSDFDSVCIKNKKHVNTCSFTNSKFFVSPNALEGHMQQRAAAAEGDDVKVSVDAESANSIINMQFRSRAAFDAAWCRKMLLSVEAAQSVMQCEACG